MWGRGAVLLFRLPGEGAGMDAQDMASVKDGVRRALLDQAQNSTLTTYRDLAETLGLAPPKTIRRVADAIEALMAEDVAAGRPLLATLCVSRARPDLPARGFFVTAAALGVFTGDPEGEEARGFYMKELQRALAFYRQD